jgi:hypothetical protein
MSGMRGMRGGPRDEVVVLITPKKLPETPTEGMRRGGQGQTHPLVLAVGEKKMRLFWLRPPAPAGWRRVSWHCFGSC